MQELVPLFSGFAVGVALGAVKPSMRWWIGALLAVALGVFATVVTGEFKASWAYVLVDIPLVAAASVCGLMLSRFAVHRGFRTG
jgi:hypothetical protein